MKELYLLKGKIHNCINVKKKNFKLEIINMGSLASLSFGEPCVELLNQKKNYQINFQH